MPKVSVIVPNYNHAKYLRQRIDSILDQTFQDFELILLDDFSTDDSVHILSTYSNHPKVKHLIFNDTNSGSTFKQWNKGLSLAKGEYIWIAESDDYAETDFLETLFEFIPKYEDVNIVYTASNLVDENGFIVGTTKSFTKWIDEQRWEHDFVNNGIEEFSHYLYIQNTIPNASAAIFKRSLYYETIGGDGTYRLCGDWKLWFQMLIKDGKICYSSKSLNNFRKLESGQNKYDVLFKPEALRLMQEMIDTSIVKNDSVLRAKIIERMFGWIFLEGDGFFYIYSTSKVSLENIKVLLNLPFSILMTFFSHYCKKYVFLVVRKILKLSNKWF